MDETRIGLHTIPRRCLTVKGIKPLVSFQQRFKNLYLFGGYSPLDGDSLTLELPYCDAACFQLYLDELSEHRPKEFKVLVLDNGAFHKAGWLRIPNNIELLFLPPYSPELNPAEMVWSYIKNRIANTAFKTLDDISEKLEEVVGGMTVGIISSIVGWEMYRNSIN